MQVQDLIIVTTEDGQTSIEIIKTSVIHFRHT